MASRPRVSNVVRMTVTFQAATVVVRTAHAIKSRFAKVRNTNQLRERRKRES